MDNHKITKMRSCSYLLPDPGGEVVRECLTEIEQLRSALQLLYDETAEYITLNNLGDVHHNRSMQIARDALLEQY